MVAGQQEMKRNEKIGMKSKNEPFQCIHCGRWFQNWNALVSHLEFCPKRQLQRSFDVGEFRFTLTLNPLKRKIMGLKSLQEEYPDKHQMFLGAVVYMQKAGEITDFDVRKITEFPSTAKA